MPAVTIQTAAHATAPRERDVTRVLRPVRQPRWGNMLFVSGQGPLDPETKTVVEGEIEVQLRRTLDNLLSMLDAAGATLASVVNMRVVPRDVADFPRFNEVFGSYMEAERVTRTCIGATPHRKGVNVEIDCVAMFG